MTGLEQATTRDWLCRFATKGSPCRLSKEWVEQQGRSYADVLAEVESMKAEGWVSYEESATAEEVAIRMTGQGREGCETIWNPPSESKIYWPG